jgi:DNA-binding FadR family transcriptional regulator
LTLQLATSQVGPQDIFETRHLLEGWAARHSEPERGDWDAAEQLLNLMDDPALPLEEFLKMDAQFHVILSRAASNPLISTLMDALRSSVADHTVARAHSLPDWPTTAARLQSEHRAILAAFRDGRREEAAELLHQHITGYYEETKG